MARLGPALIGGLLLLQLVNLPLARSLVRQRERLLWRAIDASEVERRRIAADLHDGVVQDLVGVSYSLAAEADRVGDGAAAALRAGAAQARDSVRALRTLMVDIYPPGLHPAGLAATLEDLADTLTARGSRRRSRPTTRPRCPRPPRPCCSAARRRRCATWPRMPRRARPR